MSQAQLDDLKQFILAVVSQSSAALRSEFKAEIDGMRTEMREGFAAVADAVTLLIETDDNHERRITKLERRRA